MKRGRNDIYIYIIYIVILPNYSRTPPRAQRPCIRMSQYTYYVAYNDTGGLGRGDRHEDELESTTFVVLVV